jgi:hypothetical protein
MGVRVRSCLVQGVIRVKSSSHHFGVLTLPALFCCEESIGSKFANPDGESVCQILQRRTP